MPSNLAQAFPTTSQISLEAQAQCRDWPRGQESGNAPAEVKALRRGWGSSLARPWSPGVPSLASSQEGSPALSWPPDPPLPVCGLPRSGAPHKVWPCCSSCKISGSPARRLAFRFHSPRPGPPPSAPPPSFFSPSLWQAANHRQPLSHSQPAVTSRGGADSVTSPGAVRGRGYDKSGTAATVQGQSLGEGEGLPGRGPGGPGKVQGWGGRGRRVGKRVFSGGAPPRRLDCREGPERDQSGSGREGRGLRRTSRTMERSSLGESLREGAPPSRPTREGAELA